jgi:L-ribulokinase
MLVAGSSQTPALGAAIAAAVAAGSAAGGFDEFESAQAAMTSVGEKRYDPNPAARAVYDELYGIYRELHDTFGGVSGAASAGLPSIMKRLLSIRGRVTGGLH